MNFIQRVFNKYQVKAIISKDAFKKGTKYHKAFYKNFNKAKYKEILPKLTSLFRRMNNGILKSTIIVDFVGQPTVLTAIDNHMIKALKALGYTLDADSYKAGFVQNDNGKQIPILDILKTKATKVRGYDNLKDTYEKTKNKNIEKELNFYNEIIQMGILDASKKIDIKKLAIYDQDKAKIVFTYNHRAIASQSTEVGWTSCMTLPTGKHSKHVGAGASDGTFIAYLVKKEDYALLSPTARVLFKPYFGQTTGTIIWKADKVYGTAPGNFRKTAQDIVDKYQQVQEDIYLITKNTYVDDLEKDIDTIDYTKNITDALKNAAKKSRIRYKLRFDDGGGVLMLLGDHYVHHYDDMKQAATDLFHFTQNPTTSGWEGHEPHLAKLEYDGHLHFDDISQITKEDRERWDTIDSFVEYFNNISP